MPSDKMSTPISEVLRDARRIVVKVGSSLVTNEGRGLDEQAIGEWCRQLAQLAQEGREVIMVSSGAIAEGMKRLGWSTRPSEVPALQAAAAVGQMGLAQMYETQLRANGMGSAQVLLTHADLADRERYLNARSTLLTLLQHRVLPVINENDTVATNEIRYGDNDRLAARVQFIGTVLFNVSTATAVWAHRVPAERRFMWTPDALGSVLFLLSSAISVADDDDNQIVVIDIFRPQERYLKTVIDRGTANAVVDFMIVELYNPRTIPAATSDATVIATEKHTSPDEGTA